MGLITLQEEKMRDLFLVSWKSQEKPRKALVKGWSLCKPVIILSTETKSASLQNYNKKFLLFKPLNWWYFMMAAWAN